jgi:hypothetical protein
MKIKSVATSLKLSKSVERKLLEQIIRDDYGMRGKNKWIIEAIESFLRLENISELVDIAADMEQLSAIVNIRIPDDLMKRIDIAVINIRQKYPILEGVQSNIIRASIIQRLIASK